MQSEAHQVISGIVASLEKAWNAADGKAFAASFADDSDFVTIRGDRQKGRDAIEGGHAAIFASIYKGSSIAYRVVAAREIATNVLLGHVESELSAPVGPLAGVNNAVATVILRREQSGWQLVAFHNTLVAQSAPQPRHNTDA